MEYIKRIIKEEIERALGGGVIFEKPSPKDDIIYNYDLGRVFANNTLKVDINNLNRYNLTEYLPKSITSESWSFDFETAFGDILIVDVTRNIRGGKSFWGLTFGVRDRYSDIPDIKDVIEEIEGYENFVKYANVNIANKLDPSRY